VCGKNVPHRLRFTIKKKFRFQVYYLNFYGSSDCNNTIFTGSQRVGVLFLSTDKHAAEPKTTEDFLYLISILMLSSTFSRTFT
jgi:hypothetical protein